MLRCLDNQNRVQDETRRQSTDNCNHKAVLKASQQATSRQLTDTYNSNANLSGRKPTGNQLISVRQPTDNQ